MSAKANKEMKNTTVAKLAAGVVAAVAVFGAGYGARSVEVDHQPDTESLAVPSVCMDRHGQDKLTCVYDWHFIVQAADAAAGNAQ